MSALNGGHRKIIEIAWPMTVAMLSYTAMSVVDTIFVGQLGTAPVAAVGIAYVVSHVPLSMGFGLSSGLRIAASHAIGGEEVDRARRLVWQGLWIALFVGLACALLTPIGPAVFPLLGTSEAVTTDASIYLAVRLVSAPILFLRASFIAWFHANGDTRTPMVTGVVANVLNVVLDALLIFGVGPIPALGVLGASIATGISVVVEAWILAVRIGPVLASSSAYPDRSLLRRIGSLGLPVAADRLLDVLSWSVFVGVLAAVGDAHLAAHVIAVRIVSVSFLPGLAIGEASGVVAGQSVGGGRPDAARRSWRAALELAIGLMAAFGLLFLVAPDLLISVFGASAQVASIARDVLYVAAAFQIIDAIATVSLCTLIGAGDTRFVAVLTVTAAWAVKLPLVAVLVGVFELGAPGAWLALMGELVVIGAVALTRVRGHAWLTHREDRSPALAA